MFVVFFFFQKTLIVKERQVGDIDRIVKVDSCLLISIVVGEASVKVVDDLLQVLLVDGTRHPARRVQDQRPLEDGMAPLPTFRVNFYTCCFFQRLFFQRPLEDKMVSLVLQTSPGYSNIQRGSIAAKLKAPALNKPSK